MDIFDAYDKYEFDIRAYVEDAATAERIDDIEGAIESVYRTISHSEAVSEAIAEAINQGMEDYTS